MKTLGLDIGTTSISAVVADGRQVLDSITLKNDAFLPSPCEWERIQDPAHIRRTALEAVEKLTARYPDIAAIGVTGQMHGIVYLDHEGNPVSPLYTWQDGRGNLLYEDTVTYAAYLSKLTGHDLSAGFGIVTHFYHLKNGLVPESAAVFCAIGDYIAMVLADEKKPVTDPTHGASFGLFRVAEGIFDEAALETAGIDKAILPDMAGEGPIGYYQGHIPVFAAIGDNQASFLGATAGEENCMLVNIGTGGQFSVFSPEYLRCAGLETRPYPGGYLLVGSSLCGGRAYAIFERFLRDTLRIAGIETDSCYGALDALLSKDGKPENLPVTSPLFQGTREDPTLRGSITGLDPENFTIRHLAWSLLTGMAKELHDLYQRYAASGGKTMRLLGSGNGLRKNVHLQRCFSDVFGQTLTMSACTEEAAAGAAFYAGQRSI